MQYIIRDREAGNIIDVFKTITEAEEMIAHFDGKPIFFAAGG